MEFINASPLTEEEKAKADAMWEAMTGGDYDDKKKRQEKAILVEKDLSANLFKKGLIENPCNGMINRRNASLFRKGLSANLWQRRDQTA